MTRKSWPDLRIGTGEVAKIRKFFGARWENSFGTTVLVFFFHHARHAASYKTQICFFLVPFPMPPLFTAAVKHICAINTFENCLTFYLAKYTVDISALQHYCFPQLQLICLYMKYEICFSANHSCFGLFFFPRSLPTWRVLSNLSALKAAKPQ